MFTFNCWLYFENFFFFKKKAAMEKFTTKIVDMMKSEALFESQGGPVILSQVCPVSSFFFDVGILTSPVQNIFR